MARLLNIPQTIAPSSAAVIGIKIRKNRDKILEELLAVQGDAVDVGGYYHPDEILLEKQMRPSVTFNNILDTLK